jgi:tetratricopeptide (TPR) repeat protein
MVSESIESLCQKARQSIAQGDHQQARRLYLQALGLKADSPDVHYGLATVCFLLNDLSSAAHHFREVTRLDPLRAGAFINLGAVYNRLEQLDDAIQALRRGIQLDSHRAEGYYNLGLAYRRKGQAELAIQAYREATRLNPRMGDAHLNLANLYLEKQQYGMAVAHYGQALQVRPHWDKAEHGMAQAQASLTALDQPEVAPTGSGKAPPLSAPDVLDPERNVDPTVHGAILTPLHKATIDSENNGRHVLQILEKEIEPAIKDLSSVLLYPDGPISELDLCVQKFEDALSNMRSVQRELQESIDRVRHLGDQLLKS